jgi:hypothetical protein
VQDRVARRAGIAHSDAPVAEINGGSQRRTHTDFCRDARLISLSIPRAVRHLLQRSVPERTGARFVDDNLTPPRDTGHPQNRARLRLASIERDTLAVSTSHIERDRDSAVGTFEIHTPRNALCRDRNHLLEGNAWDIRSADADTTDTAHVLSEIGEKPGSEIEENDQDRHSSVVESHLGIGVTQMFADPDLFVVLA